MNGEQKTPPEENKKFVRTKTITKSLKVCHWNTCRCLRSFTKGFSDDRHLWICAFMNMCMDEFSYFLHLMLQRPSIGQLKLQLPMAALPTLLGEIVISSVKIDDLEKTPKKY